LEWIENFTNVLEYDIKFHQFGEMHLKSRGDNVGYVDLTHR